ncbi:DUF2332 domain-containing protein [Microbacterium xanthum]|uniref:DUF2332 domain-containing protein n=1 Tax=Microbacterium xanthum TaxID=3079794 RepID=UPI002AD36E1B|nr:DUF2332 domain-containing protein [Microbacterium sp. KSW-48]MDZ8172949.1 DUF2332 domain-containing protein [Microbacterium sp. KSW-48]
MAPHRPMPDDADRLAAYYADFAARWAHGTSPLYEDWAAGIAADPEMLERVRMLPPRLHQANLLFAAARWAGAPEVPYPRWREWLTARWDAVVTGAAARATQTNEVGRCATLLPVLSRIEGPIALLEVGTAAGLCLLPDRYSYRYTSPAGSHDLHPDDGPADVVLECRVDDPADVPVRMPQVTWRAGIDVSPIDVADPEAVAWLATLVWPGPDHDARVARLTGAASLAAPDPPRIVRGDLLEATAPTAATAPEDATLVLFHSAVLLYLDAAARAAFRRLALSLGERLGRPVRWVSNESLGTHPDVDAQVPRGTDTSHRLVQSVDGIATALAGQHGAVYETAPFSR